MLVVRSCCKRRKPHHSSCSQRSRSRCGKRSSTTRSSHTRKCGNLTLCVDGQHRNLSRTTNVALSGCDSSDVNRAATSNRATRQACARSNAGHCAACCAANRSRAKGRYAAFSVDAKHRHNSAAAHVTLGSRDRRQSGSNSAWACSSDISGKPSKRTHLSYRWENVLMVCTGGKCAQADNGRSCQGCWCGSGQPLNLRGRKRRASNHSQGNNTPFGINANSWNCQATANIILGSCYSS